jgi:hypothetical protein
MHPAWRNASRTNTDAFTRILDDFYFQFSTTGLMNQCINLSAGAALILTGLLACGTAEAIL